MAAAETALQSGTAMDVQLFRQIIEVMHMDTNHEETIASYVGMLKAKISHLSGISSEQRAALQEEWLTLVDDVKAAVDEDPGGPKAQSLLDRWLSFLQALTGTDPAKMSERYVRSESALRATPELRDELWSRRAEWMPPDVARDTRVPADAEGALARARGWSQSFASPEVLEFIKRARVARMTREIPNDAKE